MRIPTLLIALLSVVPSDAQVQVGVERDPVSQVNPLIGTAGGGNTFPGAVLPFGMLSWSPENTRGDMTRAAAPGGYHYDVLRIRGFSLTHLSGTGCRGASGDIPFMPHVGDVATSPVGAMRRTRSMRATSRMPTRRRPPAPTGCGSTSGVDVDLTATLRIGPRSLRVPGRSARDDADPDVGYPDRIRAMRP